MAFAAYARNVYSAVKCVDLNIVVIQATIGAAGAVTRDAEVSSPETTITLDGAGQYSITFPKGTAGHIVGCEALLAESLGNKLYPEAFSATAGTASFEHAVTPGTAAAPAAGTRFFITLFVYNQ
jgi:hypothetical protein